MKGKQESLIAEITAAYKRIIGVERPPVFSLNEKESAASKKIVKNHAVLDTYFEKRSGYVAGTNLHPTMRTELLNFVDGKRSYYDIYLALKAESLAAGSWYYGTVTLDDVVKVLDANVEKGAMLLK